MLAERSLPTDLRTVINCRGCGQAGLVLLLPLGSTPLANSLLDGGEEEQPLYPLDLMICPACSLVQLGQIVSPERLFSDYVYFSSYSDTMLEHASELVDSLMAAESPGSSSLVVEIASNDGYLLQFFRKHHVPVLGIEPAQNIAAVARDEKGIPTVAEFFGQRLAEGLAAKGQQADIVIGNNVLAHVPELNDFVRGVATLLKPSGVAVFEAPYLKDMLDNLEFDTIYHEHQCYFSVTALAHLFNANGLQLVGISRLPIHGGSLRVFAAPQDQRQAGPEVQQLLEEEARWGVCDPQAYGRFRRSVDALKTDLLRLLDSLKAAGHSIAAYGAAAKGVTLTSYCGIGSDRLDFVVDRSPHKQGKVFPVGNLPICPPSKLLEVRPDYTLLLTWNFAAEIRRQQAEYLAAGGRFIVPVPHPEVMAS